MVSLRRKYAELHISRLLNLLKLSDHSGGCQDELYGWIIQMAVTWLFSIVSLLYFTRNRRTTYILFTKQF